MLWRYKWSLLHTTQNIQFLKTCTLRFTSIHYSSKVCVTDKTHKFSWKNHDPDQDFPKKTKLTLTPQTVHSTLLCCPSDLIALSFFFWCAKQHNYFHNHQAFDYMVNVVQRLTDRCTTVKGIVRELESVGCVTKAQTFLLLLRIYWHGKMYGMVFETFEQMGSFGFIPNTFARNIIMDVLFKTGRVDVGIKVMKETQFPNFLSFNIAICNLCKLNDLVHVKDVIRIMLRKGYSPNVETFEMILNCFCKMGRLLEAYQVLGLMITLGISLSVNIWSILIDGLCRLREPEMAGSLLEKMAETGCSPNVVTYTTLFKGFMKSHMVSSAFRVLNTMESKGFAHDLVLCNVLIDCFSKIGRYDDALDVFVGLLERTLVPDSFTFCSLLSAVRLSRRFSILLKLVDGLVIEADLVVYNSLLSYFCKAGFPSLAVELFNEMLDRGFMPDKYSFVGLLSGLCGAGRIDEAVNVYRGIVMNYPGLDAHVHTVIIDWLIRVGKCHTAVRLFRRGIIEKYPVDVVSYTVAIHGLLKGGRTEEASTLYSQMKEVGVSPNAHTYSVMLSLYCKERDTEMVKQLLQEIIEAGIELDCNTLIRVMKFLFKLHPSSSAFNHFIEMWNSGLMPDEAMNALLLNGVARGVKVGGADHSLYKGYLKHNLFVDSSSSDDLSDAAASVG